MLSDWQKHAAIIQYYVFWEPIGQQNHEVKFETWAVFQFGYENVDTKNVIQNLYKHSKLIYIMYILIWK